MHVRFLSLVAAAALLAACSSTPDDSKTTAGGGDASKSNMSSTTVPGPRAGSQEDLVANAGDRVFFNTDKSDLTPEARKTLERQAMWLKKYPTVKIAVEGHADERGTREYNLALGERRANSTKKALVSLGVDAGRISTISYGKERPQAVGHDDSSWSQNRRAVTSVKSGPTS